MQYTKNFVPREAGLATRFIRSVFLSVRAIENGIPIWNQNLELIRNVDKFSIPLSSYLSLSVQT